MENKKTIPGIVETYHEGVNIITGTRVGHDDRANTIRHIADTHERGYLDAAEANRRINAAEEAEKRGDLSSLTADLPAPFTHTHWYQRYDWNNSWCWAPTLVTGMALSAVLAVVPAAVFGAEHMFPQTALGLGVSITGIIIGIIGFFGSLAGIIAKAG